MTVGGQPNTLEKMFGTQEEHSKKHASYDTKHEEYDKKHLQHDQKFEEHAKMIADLQQNALRLENVVMNESRETRTTVTTTNQNLMDLINNLMGYKSGQNQLSTSVKLARIESWVKILGILGSSGGVLAAAAAYIFNR